MTTLAAGVAGCSMHPLPEDVTRASTVDIVRKIRCEARDALISHAVDPDRRAGLEESVKAANNKYEKSANKKQAKGERERKLRALLKRKLRDAAIGYDFRFTISESDSADGKAVLTFPFSNGKALLSLGLGETKERKADRSFVIGDDFWELLGEPKENCEPSSVSWRYPITGEIGLDEVVRTYLELLEVGTLGRNLGGSAGSKKGSGGKPSGSGGGQDVEFIDELTFTTSYNGKVEPSADIDAVSHHLKLTKLSGAFGGERKDVHNVTISLVHKGNEPPAGGAAAPKTGLVRGPRTRGSAKGIAVERLLRNRPDKTEMR